MVPLVTTLVIVAMTIPENSEAVCTGDGSLQLGLTCPPANARVWTQDPQEPQSSNDIMKSLNGKSVVIHVSGEVQTLVQYILKGPDPGSVIYCLEHQ